MLGRDNATKKAVIKPGYSLEEFPKYWALYTIICLHTIEKLAASALSRSSLEILPVRLLQDRLKR